MGAHAQVTGLSPRPGRQGAVIPLPRRPVEAERVQFSPARGSAPLALLAAGVPITLLLDLADPAGPDSRAVLREEGDESPRWLTG